MYYNQGIVPMVKEKPICSIIIPFFNEEARVLRVLRVVKRLKRSVPIICVDDGSTDAAAETIQKRYKDIVLLHHQKNIGKSAAVCTGLARVKTPFVMLLDADLKNLKASELDDAIETIETYPTIAMLVLRRKNEALVSKMVRGDVLVSGERIIRTSDLRNVMKTHPVAYEIEPAINYYMMEKQKRVCWMFHSGTNTIKINKIGFFEGMKKEIQYVYSVLVYKGPVVQAKSMLFFCRNNVSNDRPGMQDVVLKKFDEYATLLSRYARAEIPVDQLLSRKFYKETVLPRTKKQLRKLLE